MPMNQGKGWTFNTVADTYEKIRPGYPEELYQSLFAYAPLDASRSAVEVGIGAGQATSPVLKTGCALTAVEYGDQLARLCREKFSDYSRFSVVTGKFEDAELPDNTYDLVYSASAFHWVPEEIGYPKVFRILKPGGAFARFANHPYQAKDNPVLFEEIQKAYAEYYYTYYKNSRESPANTRKSRPRKERRLRTNTDLRIRSTCCSTGYGSFQQPNTGR